MLARLSRLGCALAAIAVATLAPGPAGASVLADPVAAPEPGLVYFEQVGQILAVDPLEGEPARIAAGRRPAVSPDGTRLAYLGEADGVDQLLIADVDGTDAEPVFTARGRSADGFRLGRPAWSPDGMSVAVADFVDDVAIVEIVPLEPGGTETVAAGLKGLGDTLSWSPDGAALAFDRLRSDGSGVREVVALDVGTGDGEALEPGTQPSYGPDGDIVFVRDDALRILEAGATSSSAFAPPQASGEPGEFGHRRPAYAPDGRAIVFERRNRAGSWITTAPVGGDAATRLTPADGSACCPAWAAEPPPLPGISIADASSTEGEPLLFVVSIPEPASAPVTVTGTTQQGTAANGDDFAVRSAEVTIPAGETEVAFDVATSEDAVDEADETLSVLLSSPLGGVISDGVAIGTIADDDEASGPVVSVADASALEGSDLRFAVSMPAPAATDVRVTATTSAGTAGASDFTATTEEVEIPAGLTEAGFVVPTAEDLLDEPAETLTVTLSSPAGATIGDGGATGTIVDKSRITVAAATAVTEGGTLRFPVRLDHPAATQVTVRLATQDGTAQAPGDYTARSDTAVVIPAGESQAFFDVVTAGDTLDELDETVTARILGSEGPASLAALTASGTILDDDDPAVSIADASVLEGFDLRFSVRLSAASPAPVTVTATTADASAASPADFAAKAQAITIPAGQVQAEFAVASSEDALDEPAETFTVTLSGPQGATIGDGSATGTIIDKSRVTVAAPAPVVEGGVLRFPVRLDHPAATQVTVRLGTQDGTAQAPGDYTARPGTEIVMPAGTTEAFFDVPTAEDFDYDEGDETVSARFLSSAGPASFAPFGASGTIQDKQRPTVRVDPVSATEGAPLRFPVRLSEPRPSEVTVTLSTQDGTAEAPWDYPSTSETVRIPAGRTEGVFTVPTAGDGFDEPDETVTVRLLGTTNIFLGTLLSTVGTITDDDEPLPVVRLDPPTAVGEGSPLRFPLRLDKATPGPIDIRLSTVEGTAKAPDDFTAQSLALVRIPAGATEGFLEVPTAEDDLAETDETLGVEIKSATNVRLGSLVPATGTIEDGAGPVRMLPGRLLGGKLVSGTVRVRPPGSGRYLDLGGGAGLPVGTQVDTTDGVLELVMPTGPRPVALRARAGTARARLSGGTFTIRQASRTAVVTLELTGTELRRCDRRPKAARRLLADTNGRLRVRGRYAEGTSRNGRWLTEDRCTSTRVAVARGGVAARDTVRGGTAKLRKGGSRTVRAR